MMVVVLGDHPDVEWCERTGYPKYSQPVDLICECCGDELTFDECYEDDYHDILCEFCLRKHHKKWADGVVRW